MSLILREIQTLLYVKISWYRAFCCFADEPRKKQVYSPHNVLKLWEHNLLHCWHNQYANIVGIYLQCLYAISVSSSAMVAAQRTSFLWDGKEKYICWYSSKCAEHFQIYLPLRTACFPQLLKSDPTHVCYFWKYEWITKIRNIFSFYVEAIS